VRWTESLDDHGSPIISHIISITNLADSKTTEFVLPQSSFSYIFTGLTSGVHYTMKIKSKNLVGESDWSLPMFAYAGVEPTRPDIITFVSSTRNTLQLTWPALFGEDTGGTNTNPITITNYDLYMDNGYNGDFKVIYSGPTPSYFVQYLTPGLMYRFRLRAHNSIGLQSELSTI